MANTFDSKLVADNLSRRAAEALGSALASISSFCTPIPFEAGENPANDSQIALATVAPATAIDPTSFNTGDCTITALECGSKLYAQCFGVSALDLSNGARIDWLLRLNAQKLAETILDDAILPLITVANYGAASVTSGASAFSNGDFDTLVAALDSPRRNVVLAPAYRVKVKDAWLPAGMDSASILELGASRWASAGANVTGFVADPAAIVVRHGLPLNPERYNPAEQRRVINLPGLDIQVEFTTWDNLSAKEQRIALCVYLGACKGDGNALKILASA